MNRSILPLLIALVAIACGDPETAQAQGESASPKTTSSVSSSVDRTSVQASIDKGVAFLRAQANKAGVFEVEFKGRKGPSAAHTALALAPISRELAKEKRADDALVQGATKFLLSQQREDGAIEPHGHAKYENYYTSAALMALAYINDPATAEAREKMKKFILSLQRLEDERIKGGFGYNTAKSADLSNAQYAVEALRTAGVPDTDPAMQRLLVFLERTQNRSENANNKDAKYEIDGKKIVPGNDGSAGYEPGVSKAGMQRLPDGTYIPRGYGSMTYALLKCYILVGLKADAPQVKATLAWLGDNYSWDENPGFRDVAKENNVPQAPYWGLFYYYVTAAKALRLVGADTIKTDDGAKDWRADLAAAILKRQAADGSWINTQSDRWEEKDKIITTAYAVIALQEILGKD